MTKENLKILAESRLIEAKVLLDNNLYEGCNYLLGYVIELALKARICTLLCIENYPTKFNDYKVHDLEKLLLLSGLSLELDKILKENSKFGDCWSVVLEWDSNDRYKTSSKIIKVQEQQETLLRKYNYFVIVFNWIKEKW